MKSTKLLAREAITKSSVHICMTYDYGIFKFIPGNRVPDHWREIANSIKGYDLTPYVPILVDSKWTVYDGQNRYWACRHLGLPIQYIMAPDLKPEHISVLNANQRNWTSGDYLKFYCWVGIHSYLDLNELVKEMGFTANEMLSIWSSGTRARGEKKLSPFKSGEYMLPQEGKDRIRLVFNLFSALKTSWPAEKPIFKNRSSVVRGIAGLVTLPGFDPAVLERKLQTRASDLGVRTNGLDYIDLFKYIYNFKKKTGKI